MRLMRYTYKIQHVSGKEFYIPDTLSRAPIEASEDPNNVFQIEEIQELERNMIDSIPATDTRMTEVLMTQENDNTCRLLGNLISEGWPRKAAQVPLVCRAFWSIRGELTIVRGLIMKGNALYIPTKLRSEILQRIHDGHMGIYKSIQRARDVVWWPGFTNDIKMYISRCSECLEQKRNCPEPLISSPLPQLPWQVVGTDLAERDGKNYLIIIDYYSRFPEVFLLPNSTTSNAIIERMKSAFARYGIPQEVRSDNGPQYISKEFKTFAQEYGFCHITSSPKFPQSNGQVEGTVKIIKNVISRSADPYLGLLSYRNTPLSELKYSPAQLLMGRKLRDTLPIREENLRPKTVNEKEFEILNDRSKARQKRNFNLRHRAFKRPEFNPLQNVWITDYQRYGTIKGKAETPRSYYVESDGMLLRRNSYHLKEVPFAPNSNTECEKKEPIEMIQEENNKNEEFRTRSGRVVRKPQRLNL